LEQFWHAFVSRGFVSDSWAFLFCLSVKSVTRSSLVDDLRAGADLPAALMHCPNCIQQMVPCAPPTEAKLLLPRKTLPTPASRDRLSLQNLVV